MSIEQRNFDLEVFAGPCSINRENIGDIYSIADIRVKSQTGEMHRAIAGTRIVGLKSRTALSTNPEDMGIDCPVIEEQVLIAGKAVLDQTPPSVSMSAKVVADTDMVIATEVMMPEIQVPHYVGKIPEGKLLLWNPSVDQLGWHMLQMAGIAAKNGWRIGVKNGKTLGSTLERANDPSRQTPVELERTWAGLATFAKGIDGRLVFIHRGVEDPQKGKWRSALVHEVARRVKQSISSARLFFDPSHSCGPTLRDQIVPVTINAMRMKEGNRFLYDGILIEAGHSTTDTKQHITLDELQCLVEELSRFRILKTPTKGGQI